MLVYVFTKSGDFKVLTVSRRDLDAEKADLKSILKIIKGADWIINAIGITKPNIDDGNAEETDRAVQVNSRFPHLLAVAAKKTNSKVIQIATDCVYSGQKGKYIETDPHDALDVYGKTKSLGEVYQDNFYNLRCSILGPELKGHNSLMDWLLTQPKGVTLNGFTDHLWNGITTLHFTKICFGIIENNLELPHIQHIVPGDIVTKAKLLKIITEEFSRKDLSIIKTKAQIKIDRTLLTNNKKLNQRLWKLAGYAKLPTIKQMVRELSEYKNI
jgi:dTDP-4-dehydrorhamnose reductase